MARGKERHFQQGKRGGERGRIPAKIVGSQGKGDRILGILRIGSAAGQVSSKIVLTGRVIPKRARQPAGTGKSVDQEIDAKNGAAAYPDFYRFEAISKTCSNS